MNVTNHVEMAALRTPTKTALRFEGQFYSYAQVNELGNRAANAFAQLGVERGDRIALYAPNVPGFISAYLGTLKVGAAIVAINTSLKAEETQFILADSGAKLLVTTAELYKGLAGVELPRIRQVIFVGGEASGNTLTLDALLADAAARFITCQMNADDPAAIFYTSGTTGFPKGATISHGNVIANCRISTKALAFTAADRLLLCLPLFHSFSQTCSLNPCFEAGATLILHRQFDAAAVIAALESEGVTRFVGVPSLYLMLYEQAEPAQLRSVRRYLSSATTLPIEVARKWQAKFGVAIDECYGLTETGTVSFNGKVQEKNGSVGVALSGVELRIVNDEGQEVATDMLGEVVVRGPSLMLGYWQRPAATAEVLRDGWFHTGDIGRVDGDGYCYIVDRIKDMINISGTKVYSSEVENVLYHHPAVQEVAVYGIQDAVLGEKVCASVVARPEAAVRAADLIAFTRQHLADFKVPDFVEFVDRLPKSPAGKILKRTLRERVQNQNSQRAKSEPMQRDQASIIALVQTFLADGVDLPDDASLLQAGILNSLRLIQLIAFLQEQFQIKIQPKDMAMENFESLQTIAALIMRYVGPTAQSTTDQPAGTVADDRTHVQVKPDLEHRLLPFPLTDLQEAYWAGSNPDFELGGRSVHAYYEVDAVKLDIPQFNQAWQRMIERHEMLRTVILPDGRQQILPEMPSYTIPHLDFGALPPADQQTKLGEIRQRMAHQMLTCETWPLFEILIVCLGQDRYRVFFSFDAILFDAKSKLIIFAEFKQFYQNPQLQLKPFTLSFRDYVLAEAAIKESGRFEQARAYWLQRIPTMPEKPELPLATNPATLKQPRFFQKHHYFTPDEWRQLKTLAATVQVMPSGLLLTVFSDVIRVWNKLDRFTLNLTVSNRLPLHAEVNAVVGDFTALLLLEIESAGNQSLIARAKEVQNRLLQHLQHKDFTGIQLLRELAKERHRKPGAQMPVVFTSVLGEEAPDAQEKPMDWIGEVIYHLLQTPQIWFDHVAVEEGGGLTCDWNIVEGLFPAGLMDEMFASYIAYLTRLITDESAWQEAWPETARHLVPAYQLEQRKAVNATAAPIPTDLLHTPFARQVSLRPTQPAVIAADRTLSYQELSDRANQIGHKLRDLGVKPNQLVAVVMEKGWEQVAAVIGILASGAAYLPIDPALPAERLRYLLEYGQVEIALTQERVQQRLEWPPTIQCLFVDDQTFADEPTTTLVACQSQSSEDLAYVIFTSGSTGLPKGVMIDHRGALNTIVDLNSRFQVTATDRVLALSSLTFDLSVYDIFGLLAAGGTIVMPKATDIREPAQWTRLVYEHQVTLWNTVPAFMGLLMDYIEGQADEQLASLRLVMLSGDWIPLSLPDKLQQHLKRPQLFSLGGATEASIWSIFYPIETLDPTWKSIPYGKPLLNQRFYVLNSALEPCPAWVPGQLYIGGIGLAKGYWRDVEKTNNSFIIHPRTGERLYRTGDLGRYFPAPLDGLPNIEFLGREDFQVKIQGFRVELGEIEAALRQHPAVEQVLVDARGERDAEKQLVAYIVTEQTSPILADILRLFLKQKLPAYMVPYHYVPLAELPLTANGKIDRKALPNPAPAVRKPIQWSEGSLATGSQAALLAQVTDIVKEILGNALLDPTESLFDWGATSIHMMRIANQLGKALGFRPAIDEFYMNPTVSGLLELYAAAQNRLALDTVAFNPQFAG